VAKQQGLVKVVTSSDMADISSLWLVNVAAASPSCYQPGIAGGRGARLRELFEKSLHHGGCGVQGRTQHVPELRTYRKTIVNTGCVVTLTAEYAAELTALVDDH
jgi:hypothetical protein